LLRYLFGTSQVLHNRGLLEAKVSESIIPIQRGAVSGDLSALTVPAPGFQDDIAAQRVCRVVRKYKLLILGCLVGMVVLSGIISALLPRRYEAVARVLVNPQDSNALGLDPIDALAGNGLSNDIVQQTQVRILQSDPLAWNVIKQLRLDQRRDFAGHLAIEPGCAIEHLPAHTRILLLAAFREALRIEAVPKTELIEVRFRARDPQLAADGVNALTNAYIERNFRTRYEATLQASDWLSKQLDDLRKSVEGSQQRFTEYQKKSGIIGTDDTHNVFIVQLDELNKQMAGAEAERILREARVRVAVAGNPELIADVAPTGTLAILRAQQADLKNQYAELSAKFGSAYPRVEQVSTQLRQVQDAIIAEIKEVRGQLEEEYQAASTTEQMLAAELEVQKQKAYKMNDAGIQFAILKRDVDSSRDLYEGLMKKLKEAGILAGLHSTNVDVIDPAEVPIKPAEPRILLNVAVACFLGMFGGVGLALLLENLDNTITAPESGDTLANMPMLGVVPHMTLSGNRSHKQVSGAEADLPFLLSGPDSQFAEALRALRTTLLLSSPGAPPKVIIVSSAAPGEGKTTMSINLALTLAQKGARVLLVDADMRRSGAQGRLGMQGVRGLSSCLAGSMDAHELIKPLSGETNLDVLPSGPRPPNPVELLDSERMRRLLEQWRDHYNHIVIDTPPLVGLSDALVLCPFSDAVLLVARSAHTSRQSLLRARDILVRINAHTVGVIINDLNLESVDYYDYNGYYGSKYGQYYAQDARS
jgi:polysaccharide biosynthesis transport protein